MILFPALCKIIFTFYLSAYTLGADSGPVGTFMYSLFDFKIVNKDALRCKKN